MQYVIPYSLFPCAPDVAFPAGHTARRPVLQLEIVNGANRLPCYAIVDSGADHCTFPLSFALQLGLDPLKKTPASCIGVGNASVSIFYWDITLDFGPIRFEAYAGFTPGLEAQGLGLLGQCGFFDRLKKIVFDHQGGVFHLETSEVVAAAT